MKAMLEMVAALVDDAKALVPMSVHVLVLPAATSPYHWVRLAWVYLPPQRVSG
jgi:hypothetical protein